MKEVNDECSDCTPEEKALNKQILKKIMDIRENYHELTKFLSEMPMTVPNEDTPQVREKQLRDYLQSLDDLVARYQKENGGKSKLYEQE